MVGPFRPETDARSVVQPEPSSLALFAGDLQPLTPPDAFNPLVIDRPARRLQHLGDPAITEPAELADQLDDIRDQRGAELLDGLDGLEELRRGLLLGSIPKDRLGDLARLVREKRERGADPVVSRLLDEIELRAEVEIAKLSRRI